MTLPELIARLEQAEGPDRGLDALIAVAVDARPAWAMKDGRKLIAEADGNVSLGKHGPSLVVHKYTGSLDAVTALVQQQLPGWWWKVGTCSVSDDACIGPDFNDPVHGPRLLDQFEPVRWGSEFDSGFDVDRRPSGNVPIALLIALFRALAALRARGERG